MRPVYVLGTGQLPVVKETELGIRQLGAAAVRLAMDHAGVERVDALFVGNMMSGILSHQQQLGALIADAAGLRGIEAGTAEAACSSGAAAVRWGTMAVASGLCDSVAICGVELMTHREREHVTAALATASDWEREGCLGETFVTLNARLMELYAVHYGHHYDDFGIFAVNAHKNANNNPNALFQHKLVSRETYLNSKAISGPLRLFDASPICTGAASLILCSEAVKKSGAHRGKPSIRIAGSAVGTDSLSIDERRDPLFLDGVAISVKKALALAEVGLDDIDLFEAHDAYTIMTAMSIESSGFAPPGLGLDFAAERGIGIDGGLPLATMGGLKARGHPVGATGVYQLVECYQQLSEEAGANQISNARVALAQNFGGTGATVVSTILIRDK